MAFVSFVSVTNILEISSPLSYPLNKPIRSDKASVRLAGGGRRSETVGAAAVQTINLSFKHLESTDVQALRDWVLNVAQWDAVPFTYSDENGIPWKVVIISEEFNPIQVSYLYYELNIDLEVVP